MQIESVTQDSFSPRARGGVTALGRHIKFDGLLASEADLKLVIESVGDRMRQQVNLVQEVFDDVEHVASENVDLAEQTISAIYDPKLNITFTGEFSEPLQEHMDSSNFALYRNFIHYGDSFCLHAPMCVVVLMHFDLVWIHVVEFLWDMLLLNLYHDMFLPLLRVCWFAI